MPIKRLSTNLPARRERAVSAIPSIDRHRNSGVLALFTVAGVFAICQAAVAQVPDTLTQGIAGIDVTGGGWSQAGNIRELVLFVTDVLVVAAISALVAYHPCRRRHRLSLSELKTPRFFYLYGLLGLAIGFLVEQHGYIIGFVVFGIGGLVRFRTDLENSDDTVEMIIVTFLGLCVGLNLPVMAILIALAAWVILYLTGRLVGYELNLKSEDRETLETELEALSGCLAERRWPLMQVARPDSKDHAIVTFRVPYTVQHDEVRSQIELILKEEKGGWKLKS